MTVRLLVNENFPRPALLALRTAGLDVAAVSELMPAASDREVLVHAATNGQWLVTFDRDYGELVFARKAPSAAGDRLLETRHLRAIVARRSRPRRSGETGIH